LDGHSLKISDFFINVKLPRRARDTWPLVISGGEIAWVPGYRLAHPFRLHSGSMAAVHIQLTRMKS
jgi:tRNA(Ile)-lysidine synthase